jgi:hypothetical protein
MSFAVLRLIRIFEHLTQALSGVPVVLERTTFPARTPVTLKKVDVYTCTAMIMVVQTISPGEDLVTQFHHASDGTKIGSPDTRSRRVIWLVYLHPEILLTNGTLGSTISTCAALLSATSNPACISNSSVR